MSKEAIGENGSVLGSSAYWNSINSATFFGKLMQRPSETNYHATLSEVGGRASAAVDEIYNDLQEHINSIHSIPSDHRNALAKQVQSLYDVCGMSGGFCIHSSDCIGILSLSSFYLPTTFSQPTIRSTSIIAHGNPIKATLLEGILQGKRTFYRMYWIHTAVIISTVISITNQSICGAAAAIPLAAVSISST